MCCTGVGSDDVTASIEPGTVGVATNVPVGNAEPTAKREPHGAYGRSNGCIVIHDRQGMVEGLIDFNGGDVVKVECGRDVDGERPTVPSRDVQLLGAAHDMGISQDQVRSDDHT